MSIIISSDLITEKCAEQFNGCYYHKQIMVSWWICPCKDVLLPWSQTIVPRIISFQHLSSNLR